MYYKNLLLLILVLFNSMSYAQHSNRSNFINDSLDTYIKQAMHDWQIPGLAVGIVKNGKVIIEKGYGVSDINTAQKVNKQTLFMIGSNTKAFTGTALSFMEYDKKCKLSDKVVMYLPNFKMYDSTLTNKVNLVDLMTHRIGYKTFQGDFMYFDSDLSDDEMLETMSRVKPAYDFRTRYGYCNAGYFVAGKCIEQICNKTWDEYLNEKIFTPAGMLRTFTKVNQIKEAENACKPYTYIHYKLSEIPYGGLDLLGPAAAISSSIQDMNIWTTMLLDSGKYKGKNIIPQQVIDRTRTPEFVIGNGHSMFNKLHFRLYGLGWNLADYENYKIVSHTGGIHGFVTSVTLIPELNIGIVVLTNTDQNWFYYALKSELVDAYLNLPYRDYSTTYLNINKKYHIKDSTSLALIYDSVAMHIKPTIALKNFTGLYKNEMYGTIEIKLVNKLLQLTFEHHPELSAKLEYIGNNRFLCTYSNPSQGIRVFPFVIKNKTIKSFTLSTDPSLETTTYKFIKVKQ